jgi:hypothetical protein
MNITRVAVLVVNVVVVVVANAVYLCRRNAKLPRGSEVERINGRPVLKFPFIARRPTGDFLGNDSQRADPGGTSQSRWQR